MAEHEAPNIDAATLGKMFHGIRADPVHWKDVWNFSLIGTRGSVETLCSVEQQPSVKDAPLRVLREDPRAFPGTFLSGFGATVLQGAMIRSGMRLGVGIPPYPTRWLPPDAHEAILFHADREVLLESVRRRRTPQAACRLSCLWTADNTVDGRAWVERMMGRHSFTFEVDILHATRASRCDAKWLDAVQSGDETAAEGYWSGQAEGRNPTWEYLVEGVIRARDVQMVERMRAWAIGHVQGRTELP